MSRNEPDTRNGMEKPPISHVLSWDAEEKPRVRANS